MKKGLLILFCLPLFSLGQCESNCNEERLDFSTAIYLGCVNDSDIPDGKGILKFDSGEIRDGCWENGKMNGLGKYVSADKNNIYEGIFKNDDFYGNGILTIRGENQIDIKEGFFKSGNLFNGTETITWRNGQILVRTYKDAEIINEKRNTENIYDIKDIIGDAKSTVLILERRDNHFWIKMEINGTQGEWYFDTGGEGLSIGKKLWDRLLDAGVKFKNLVKDIESTGVSGGVTKNKYVLIDEIGIGDYKVKNVVALIRYETNYSLMGVQFYDKFSNVEWNMKDATLEFYK